MFSTKVAPLYEVLDDTLHDTPMFPYKWCNSIMTLYNAIDIAFSDFQP